MSEQPPCPDCAGCGEVVQPETCRDQDGKIQVVQRANICRSCGGTGKSRS